MVHRRLVILAAFALSACGASDEQDADPMMDAGCHSPCDTDSNNSQSVTIEISSETSELSSKTHLIIESLEGNFRQSFVSQTNRFSLDGLIPGYYRFTAFLDRNDDATFNSCPYPHSAENTENSDSYDNISGFIEAFAAPGSTLSIKLSRHICGPGDLATGLRGNIEFPGLLQSAPTPIVLLLEPTNELAEDSVTSPTTLRIPLISKGSEDLSFDIGELIPGNYNLIFFADADADLSPNICSEPLGGADRFLAKLQSVEIIEGMRRDLGTIVFKEFECPENLTGFSASLSLGELSQLEQTEETLSDPVFLQLTPIDRINTPNLRQIFTSLNHRALTQPFTVTGLTAGEYKLQIWLDHDRDMQFLTCDTEPSGLDRVYVERSISIEDGQILDLGALELQQLSCDTNTVIIQGSANFTNESGMLGLSSGRPMRLKLTPYNSGATPRDWLIFENTAEIENIASGGAAANRPFKSENATFARTGELVPGSYYARFYIDSDNNGRFNACNEQGFGDRALSELFEITVESNQTINFGNFNLNSLECALPNSAFAINLGANENIPLPADLRAYLVETGGWSYDLPLEHQLQSLSEPLLSSSWPLAPGRYNVTVYLDADQNGEFECESEADTWSAQANFILDAANPFATLDLNLSVCQ